MRICSCATTNAHLKAWIISNGQGQRCDACGAYGRATVPVARLAEHIDRVVAKHYAPDLDYHEYGEDASDLIQRRAGVDADMAAQVQRFARHGEHPGNPTLYDYGPLHLKTRVVGKYSTRWNSLKKIVKLQARFCGAETRPILDMLLGDMTTFCEGAAIRHLGPQENIFRARKARSAEEALHWCKAHDDSDIRAPDEQPANRMNATGIRAFYGALEDRIAIAEVKPSIGSYIVLGSFVPTRALAVVDFGALGDVLERSDVFDPEFDAISERLVFLRMLEHELSLPIQPAEDPIGYVPTQVVAEYVHVVLGLDGLAYRSTQTGDALQPGQLYGGRQGPMERNVVLFGGAAVTTSEERQDGLQPGLRFLLESRQVVAITRINICYRETFPAHYEPPLIEG